MVALLNAVHTAPLVRAPIVSQSARAALRTSALPARRSVVVRASADKEARSAPQFPVFTQHACLAICSSHDHAPALPVLLLHQVNLSKQSW